MLRRLSSGISPLKYEKRMHKNTSALQSTFRRVNLSLAGCSSAEPASVSVQNKIQCIKLYLQTVEKANHVHNHNGIVRFTDVTTGVPEKKSIFVAPKDDDP